MIKTRVKKIFIAILSLLMTCGILMQASYAARIKDIAQIAGVRSNQLVGYGLVVGLNGSGDKTAQTPFTDQSFKNMLTQFGVRLPENVNFRLRNVAAVAVSAKLPPFLKAGQTIDVTISSIGNASSLQGGTLLMTPLMGADGKVYAIAQGSVVVSGIGAQGADGSRVTVNSPASGHIPNGATVERMVPAAYIQENRLVLNLFQPDFTTAQLVADRINEFVGGNIALPLDAASIQVMLPKHAEKNNYDNHTLRVWFISDMENLLVDPAEAPAKIVVNSKTGTIVIGKHVKVAASAVSHGSLTVTISENPTVSQPQPLSLGETTVVPSSDVKISQEKNRAFVFEPGATLQDIVNAINRVGAAPADLIAILEALKEAGAIQGELVII